MMIDVRRPDDHITRLPDGRTIGYAQYGDPNGFPIVNAHGGLACRLDVAAAAPVARRAGVRLISADRPGIGLSDPLPDRTIQDWACDIGALVEQLDIDRFAVMGWSMGGQYALAVGHALRHRVSRVAIIAGALPLTEPGVFDELPLMDRVLTRSSQRAPQLARPFFAGMRFAARRAPALYGRLAARSLGPADGAVIRDEGFATFALMSREALRQLSGVLEEYRAWARPWGFDPEDLDVPVDVWTGTADELVNPSWPHRLAERIPGATLNIRSGGHFMAHLHYLDIFDALRR
jgi:pimeloyl-ACP methyl ester carboxylesterase